MVQLLSKILPFKIIQVVGIILKDDIIEYYCLTVKLSKNKLLITAKNKFLEFENLCSFLDKKTPSLLVIDGKGILTKKIDYNNAEDVVWTKNLDYNALYHLTLKTTTFNFVSFCRKNVVNDILNQLISNEISVLDFYIGPLSAYLSNKIIKSEEIFSNEVILKFSDGELVDLIRQRSELASDEYNLGGEILSKNYISLYGAAIDFFLQQDYFSKSISDLVDKDEKIYKKAFNSLGLIGLIAFFISLLFSYLLTNYFNKKNSELILENVYTNQNYEAVISLEKQKENKMKILNMTGSLLENFHSFYSFEISKSVPQGIFLTNMNIFPLKDEIKTNDQVLFDSKVIIIDGNFQDEDQLNQWINYLKSKKWINTIEIIFLKKNKNNISQFELKINV